MSDLLNVRTFSRCFIFIGFLKIDTSRIHETPTILNPLPGVFYKYPSQNSNILHTPEWLSIVDNSLQHARERLEQELDWESFHSRMQLLFTTGSTSSLLLPAQIAFSCLEY